MKYVDIWELFVEIYRLMIHREYTHDLHILVIFKMVYSTLEIIDILPLIQPLYLSLVMIM